MTRVSMTRLVQRVDDQLVVMDEATGEEVAFSGDEVERVRTAIDVLFPRGGDRPDPD